MLEYSKPQIGGGQASPTDPKIKVDGTPLTGGFISIQAETAPADFRKIELLNLEGCMDEVVEGVSAVLREVEPRHVQVGGLGTGD